jgi:tetratricopeptide (TPR) repeat protein
MAQVLTHQQLAKQGKSAYRHGDYLTAAQAFEAARAGYEAAGDELEAAEMGNNSSVAYLQAGENEKALQAAAGTAEIFVRAGDLRRQGMALGNLGAALEALERNQEALETYHQAAAVLEQAGEDQMRAQVLQSLSMLQYNMGRQLQALATMKSGLDGVKRPSPKQTMLKKLLNIPFEMINRKG